MPWTEKQIKQHKKAAKLLDYIKNDALDFIKKYSTTTEYQVQKFILHQFKKYSLINEVYDPIVAFQKNTSYVHYFPKRQGTRLQPNSLILIDIWARLKETNAPYADITWMAHRGKKPRKKILDIFSIIIRARDTGVKEIEKYLKNKKIPTGKMIDTAVRNYITKKGYGANFPHGTGHILGIRSPHGTGGNIHCTNQEELNDNVGYTIEPGIYLADGFGIRSEINIIVTNELNLIITTPPQKRLTAV